MKYQFRWLKLIIKFCVAAVFALATFEFVANMNTADVSASVMPKTITDNVFTKMDTLSIPKPAEIIMNVNTKDDRAAVLDKYFAKYNSPLIGFGEFMVQMCDKYNLPSDCTLIPAIAYTETRLCTLQLSGAQRNCWGWGGSGDNRVEFQDFYVAIETVSKGLSQGYGAYLNRPDLISLTYCGDQCTNWAKAVSAQQVAINNLAKELGLANMSK